MMDAVDEEALQLRRSEFEVLRTVPWCEAWGVAVSGEAWGCPRGDGREGSGSGWIAYMFFLLGSIGNCLKEPILIYGIYLYIYILGVG